MREIPHVNWWSSTSSVILLQIAMVCPGTHPVRNHESVHNQWFPVNPSSPNTDQHQFSPNNIHTMSRDKVMRINKMIA